jgi:hypothetical protein
MHCFSELSEDQEYKYVVLQMTPAHFIVAFVIFKKKALLLCCAALCCAVPRCAVL